ncbi:PAS domain-containing sensor histidine kinase [Phyllobacterium endophyticum]|uniref:PAS domain-containing sensor histidine kinase n=1 Tax=Phyllobacterium endophyticum TaxID=1149773 RepID=UPI0011CA267C|nr:HAMP domain-containing sensor histidine kinase [Phyllobacterium endophyticum]TXR46367.1 HAMP domain-containing histidine kinase [Phyllobacterium endophyticum]
MNSQQVDKSLVDDFEDFFEQSLNGYVIASPKGVILRANARIGTWLGYAADELTSMNVTDLLSIGGKIFFETHLRPLLHMQGMFDEVALELIGKDGKRLPVIANAMERKNEGSVVFVRFTFFRAVDRRKYEQNLREERAQAVEGLRSEQEVSALREQFIAVLGHDLRNPLASIDAGIRLLAKTPLDERAVAIVDLIRSSTARMAALIDDILDFARGRLGGGISLDLHPVLLKPVLLHAVEELRISNPQRQIKTQLDLSAPVLCDPGRLSQLVSNLLANALTHGAHDGLVRLSATQDASGFELIVANTGRPIQPSVLQNLFQPFKREDERASQQGLGLGLYICSQIAQAHGGTLSASSDETETRFTLKLPAAH